MARLPALIRAFEKVDGRDRSAIEHVARVIREEDYIPTTKRGVGASEMTSVEAVNLLLALNGASSPKEGPVAIERLRAMLGGDPTFLNAEPFRTLADISNFGTALEYLIDSYPAFVKHYASTSKEYLEFGVFYLFDICIELHLGYAFIYIKNIGTQSNDFARRYSLPSDKAFNAMEEVRDRRVSVSLGSLTVDALWRCLSGQPSAGAR